MSDEATEVEQSTLDPLKAAANSEKDDSGEITSLSGTFRLNEDGTEWKPPVAEKKSKKAAKKAVKKTAAKKSATKKPAAKKPVAKKVTPAKKKIVVKIAPKPKAKIVVKPKKKIVIKPKIKTPESEATLEVIPEAPKAAP